MSALIDVLSRSQLQVTEARFVELVEQSLAELGGPIVEDPASVLSDSDVAALTAVNAALAPRGRREVDPRVPAVAAYSALLADSLTVAAVAQRLGIDASRVRHRLAAGQLIGIKQARGWALPAYQFAADGGLLPGLERVAGAFVGSHPVVVARFFATVQPELVVDRRPVTPRQWLEGGGNPESVAKLARAVDRVA